MIIKIVEKNQWYMSLIAAGCPARLLPTAFVILDYVDGVKTSDRYGWAYPTREQISDIVGKGVNAVTNDTKELSDHGWLIKEVVQRAGGKKTFYQLAYGSQWEVNEYKRNTSGLRRGANSVNDVVPTPSTVWFNSVNDVVPTPWPTDNKHKLETSTETETRNSDLEEPQRGDVIPEGISDCENTEHARDNSDLEGWIEIDDDSKKATPSAVGGVVARRDVEEYSKTIDRVENLRARTEHPDDCLCRDRECIKRRVAKSGAGEDW